MNSNSDIKHQIRSSIISIMRNNLKDPRKAVLIISKIKLPNGKIIGITNAEIAYDKGIIHAIKYNDKYKFNNTALIKRCNYLVKRSLIKKKKKKN